MTLCEHTFSKVKNRSAQRGNEAGYGSSHRLDAGMVAADTVGHFADALAAVDWIESEIRDAERDLLTSR